MNLRTRRARRLIHPTEVRKWRDKDERTEWIAARKAAKAASPAASTPEPEPEPEKKGMFGGLFSKKAKVVVNVDPVEAKGSATLTEDDHPILKQIEGDQDDA